MSGPDRETVARLHIRTAVEHLDRAIAELHGTDREDALALAGELHAAIEQVAGVSALLRGREP